MRAFVDGEEVKVGDCVGFKYDIEQSGQITGISRSSATGGALLELKNDSGFEGGYIGGQTEHQEEAANCWID